MVDRHTVILTDAFSRQRAQRMAVQAPEGWVFTASPPARTNAQNDAMWALLTDVSHARPMGRVHKPEVWKCIFMDSTGHKVKWVPSLDGESVVNVGYRSSRLTKQIGRAHV